MKIPIDPKLAAETLKQTVPQYDELIAKLQSDSEIFSNIVQFAKKTGLSGYPLLYLDKQIHIKLVLLTLMPVEQINSFNEFVKTLTPDEAIAYANQAVQNLNQSPEKLDEILDPLMPDNPSELDSSQLTDQEKIVLTAFLVLFHDIVSFLVHGRRITDLVQCALNEGVLNFV